MTISKVNLTDAISGTIPAGNINNATLNNVTALPAAVPTGKLKLISEQTASGSASIEFTTGIDSTYPIYKFEFINIHPSVDGSFFQFNMSTDGGSNYNVTKTTTVFATYHFENDTATSLSYRTSDDLAQSTSPQILNTDSGADNDQSSSGSLLLFNPSSTTFVKHFLSDVHFSQVNDLAMRFFTAGYGNTTSSINAIKFYQASGNIDSGTIKLYGIKDS